ncbi:MAG: molybdopterin-synthase adenylyltransferase MoeB, partial [Deltaproteobacteria bacterium]|nr:molybdopterin-synthase adenylyltransferase MoeB [Deltaproteobacteria bacterium]
MTRYQRQILPPEIGKLGQEKLKASRLLIVGVGGLGSPAALYLALAGVGRVGLVDFDQVDLSNLHRQILYREEDVGKPKLQIAKEKLNALNPQTQVDLYETKLTAQNALDILKNYDVILDGTDNFQTRLLVNDACFFLKKPNVYGSIFKFEGQLSVFDTREGSLTRGPCYRCLYPEPPAQSLIPNCAEAGVLGVLPGIVGTLQATEALKLLLGIGKSLVGKLLFFDTLSMKFNEMQFQKRRDCQLCGETPTIVSLGSVSLGIQGGICMSESNDISVFELKKRLDKGEELFL